MSPQRVSLLTFPKAAAVSWETSGEADVDAWMKLVCKLCIQMHRRACPSGVAKALLSRECASEGTLYGNDSVNCILSKLG